MPDAPFYRKSLLAMLLFLAGCGKSPEDKLAGKWVGDRIDNVSGEEVAGATGWVKMTTFEFAGDSITVTIPGEAPRKGTYKVSHVEGDTFVLSVARSDTRAIDEATLTMRGDKSMSWDIGNGKDVLLVRTGL